MKRPQRSEVLATIPTTTAGALSKEAAEFWEIANQAEAAVEGLAVDAMPYALCAGAAFHLAKLEVDHGQWEQTIKARSPFSLRTVQQRMQTVDNALARLGFTPERRDYEAIVFSSKFAKSAQCALLATARAKELLRELNAIFAGKNSRQIELELGIRKPKSIKSGRPYQAEEDAAKVDRDRAMQYLTAVREGVIALSRLAKHFDKGHWNQFAWTLRDGLVGCVPHGWPLLIQPPLGEPAINLDAFLKDHIGPRRAS